LDVQPLAKLSQHAGLDRRVVAAALQHPQLLQQQLLSYERWVALWLTQQQQQQQQQQSAAEHLLQAEARTLHNGSSGC
jgi:hypothetical protein